MKVNATHFQTLSKLLLLLCLMAFATGLSAQVRLSVQGLVKKSDGTALADGNYDLSFRFYDAEVGGGALATETVTTEINGGVYSAILGGGGGLDMLPFDKAYYVSVAVDGGTELLPRIALSAAPYAVSLQGANNKFPSTGTVKADAIEVAPSGAVSAPTVNATTVNASGDVTANRVLTKTGAFGGYVFQGSGSNDGIISPADNEVSVYTNGSERLKVTDAATTAKGPLFSDNKIITNSTNGGFSFSADGAYDTGLFSGGADSRCDILSNGFKVAKFGTNEVVLENTGFVKLASSGGIQISAGNDVTISGSGGGSNSSFGVGGAIVMNLGAAIGPTGYLYINGMKPKGTTGNPRNLAIDMINGRVFEESSSRRYKKNIRPLQEDFSLLLKAQPRIYNRFEDPADIDTTKYFEIGYIAEEIDSIGLRRVVQYNNEGQIDGVDYTKMILYAVEVLKTQHADIDKLKAEVAALTAEKNALRTENASLRTDAQNQQANFGKQLDELSRRLKSLETAASNR